LGANDASASRVLFNYADAAVFSGFESELFSALFEEVVASVDSEVDFLLEIEDELPLDSDSFGRLSVMYQPEPLNTTPTG